MNSNFQDHIPPGMLIRVIQNKQDKIMFYKKLLNMITGQENIDLIRGILDDEINHFNKFYTLYTDLFNEQLIIYEPAIPQINSLISGIEKSIVEEINTYRFYCNIYFYDPNDRVRNTFLQALADENIHSTILNYILTKVLN